jgi:hypothetical protein
MWRPHTFKNLGLKWSLVSQGRLYFGLDMCLTLRRLVSRLVPLLLFWVYIAHFQLWSENKNFKPHKTIGLDWSWNPKFIPNKEGPTLKPSSPRLDTCQVQNTFTLAHQSLIQKQRFQTCMAFKLINESLMPINYVWHFTIYPRTLILEYLFLNVE